MRIGFPDLIIFIVASVVILLGIIAAIVWIVRNVGKGKNGDEGQNTKSAFCPNCGASVSPSANFCARCGEKVVRQS